MFFIDPDGREPVPGINALNPWFKLKPTQWYMYTDGVYHSKSFNAAAVYSTKHLRADAYQTVYQRNAYYGWVQEQVNAKGYTSKWFGAAELVTGFRGVGGTELPNLWFIKDNTEAFLKGGNEFLFSHNMKNAQGLLANGKLSGSFTDANGANQSFNGLTGMDLDFKMVEFEQSKVQEYINSYSGKDLDKIMNNINDVMNGRFPSSEVRGVIKEHFNGKFDFGNYEDRVKLGQELIRNSYDK